MDEALIQKFLEDTRAAITFVREQGAEKIILVGASLGGCASAKLAVESQASGIVVLASPPSISQWGFEIQSADLNTDIPKLFITAENDNTVPADATRNYMIWLLNPRNGRLIQVLRMAQIYLKGKVEQNCNSAFWVLFR